MASSFVDRSKLIHVESFASLPVQTQHQFAKLEEAVGQCLCEAAKLGHVIIITNAETGWVEYSSKRFMPRLLPLLERIRVVSARSTYERFYPGAPLCWKAAAFAHEANQLFNAEASTHSAAPASDTASPSTREIISFGDSNEERTAVKIASGQLGAVAKSVKFCESPNPEQLVKQVEVVTSWLQWLVGNRTELDLMLKSSDGHFGTAMATVDMSHVDGEPFRPPPMAEIQARA